MRELLDPRIDRGTRLEDEVLAEAYRGSEGSLESPALFSGRFDPEKMSVRDLHAIFEQKIVEGELESVVESSRDAQAVIEQIHNVTSSFPWLGRTAVLGMSQTIEPRTFEIVTANHMFDDNPLIFGISPAEGDQLRGFMENEIEEFRRIAALTFVPS